MVGRMKWFLLAAAAIAGCGVPTPRYPSDVQAALAGRDMRRMETPQLLLYYPEGRRAQAERMAARIELCATEARLRARVDNRHSREKMIVVVPDAPFNNAYVMPPALGLQDVAVVPAGNTLDFATSFGLPPDPGMVGCHEIIHYVHAKQIAGFWGAARTVLGDLLSPQVGLDVWFFEGLATLYEAQLQPGAGRPRWPVFTGMFHAAYAGGDDLSTGDLSERKRHAGVGHHYLVGSMFVEYLAETYGDGPLWRVVERQARSSSVLLGVSGHFHEVYGRGIGELFDGFRRWVAAKYPVRARPPNEQVVRALGDDARWAWGPRGEVAVIDVDVDEPARLRVWAADGRLLENKSLVDLLPPRRLVIGGPLFVSGMSFAADGSLWFTSLDLGNTFQTTRLFRWRRGDGIEHVTSGLGPGGAVSADARTYFHMIVDGDRWSLAAHPLDGGPGRVVWEAPAGQFVLRVAPSPDGARLAASVWDGTQFAVWVLDAATGARAAAYTSPAGPLYDPAWAPDGRLMMLEVVNGRFQVAIVEADGSRAVVTDAPYGALEARAHGGALRFLARDGWNFGLDEIALPPPRTGAAPPAAPSVETPAPASPELVLNDQAYSRFDGLFRPTLHALSLVQQPDGKAQWGVTIGGGDRLDLVRWMAAAFVEPQTWKVTAAGGLLLNDLAPWQVFVQGQRHDYTATVLGDPTTPDDDREEDREWRLVQAQLGRTSRGTYSAALGGTYDYYDGEGRVVRLYGPFARLGYQAIEGTRYTGARRGLGLDIAGAYFPKKVGEIVQGRAQVDAYAPLPFTRRHILHARLRAHGFRGADAPILQVGGWSPLAPLYDADELESSPAQDERFPLDVAFAEPLRGFEDAGFVVDRAGLLDVSWTYPLIIDRGVASFWIFPSTFVSQIDLELFAAGAILRPEPTEEDVHAAAGAAVTLRFALFRIPLLVRYQGSRRLTDDEQWLQLVGLGTDI
jgi:hypothetical protein